MKRIYLVLIAVLVTVAAHAQFEAGKYYVGASLSAVDAAGGDIGRGHVEVLADNLVERPVGFLVGVVACGVNCGI